MASLRMTIQLADQAFDRIWPNMVHDVEDFREPFEQMAEVFWEMEEKRFDAEGPGWAPLAVSTRWDRHYHGYSPSGPILVRTGALRESLTSPFGEGSIYEVYPDELVLGSDIEVGTKTRWNLGRLHQDGTRHMPARPPVMFTSELTSKWSDIMEQWLRDEFNYQG